MKILLLTHAFNSLSQRLFVDLRRLGHEVTVEFDINDQVTVEAVALARPHLVIAPFLKRAIPEEVWRNHLCLVVHPGPEGDRGASSLDWAILEGRSEWGVTVLQAEAGMDAGPVWESRRFAMRPASKSSLYRHEVTEAAVEAVLAAVARFPGEGRRIAPGPLRRPVTQADRAIDWQRDGTAAVLRKIRSADGMPGVADRILGLPVFLHDARDAAPLSGAAGAVIAEGGGAVAVGTVDGAVWIGHLRAPDGFKLPAGQVLGTRLHGLPEVAGPSHIRYEEQGGVGILHFAFLNGAMSTAQCGRLLQAYHQALRRPTRVVVLAGGADFWSNGINLNQIEAAASPADESWRNINAMNDLARAVITTTSHLTVAALGANAGAGGVFLALAADEVWARRGVILNPHYKGMGNLYGSEYWTYLLPRRAGAEAARRVTAARLPMGVDEARECKLVDRVIDCGHDSFTCEIKLLAESLSAAEGYPERLFEKKTSLEQDEKIRPLDAYREAELAEMSLNFYGFDPSYHVARYNFVRKLAKSRTPLYLATHRRKA
ncbi:MAG TPA: hydrogenase maturation protein [Rhodospirillaceae bacterium]|nr:hydrogenase maturation protein [Rhodospirillaceae bacterium]